MSISVSVVGQVSISVSVIGRQGDGDTGCEAMMEHLKWLPYQSKYPTTYNNLAKKNNLQ